MSDALERSRARDRALVALANGVAAKRDALVLIDRMTELVGKLSGEVDLLHREMAAVRALRRRVTEEEN